MEEVKRSEQRATVEDLMYASVLEKFVEVGVDMLPTLDSITESQETLKVGNVGSARSCCCSLTVRGSQHFSNINSPNHDLPLG
jgi:hypothetical protein